MKLSLLYELQRPRGADDYDAKVVHECIEQAELADQAGFDRLWMTEHHFLVGFSHSPCQDLVLAAISQRTRRIRLGMGVVVLPYHHPVMVAERMATLDQLCNGRLDFGTGRGAPYEQIALGVDPLEGKARWEESLRIITSIWSTEGEFSYEGKFWQVPPRTILPGPRQRPHPPLWIACSQFATYETAAAHGLGVLSFNPNRPATLRPYVDRYRQDIAAAEPTGAYRNAQWANFVNGLCGDDARETRELAAQATRNFFGPGRPYAAASYQLFKSLVEEWGDQAPPDLLNAFNRANRGDLTGAAQDQQLKSIWEKLDADTLCDSGAIIAGSPEQCLRSLEQHRDAGADEVLLVLQNATVPHERIMRSIELLGEHVIPEVARWETPARAMQLV